MLHYVLCIPLSINHAIHRRTNDTTLLMKEAHLIQFLSYWHRAMFSVLSALIIALSTVLWIFGYPVPLLMSWYLWYGRVLNFIHLVWFWNSNGTNQMHRYQTPFAQMASWTMQKVSKCWTMSHYLYHSELVWNRMQIDMDSHDETLRVLDDGLVADHDPISNVTTNLEQMPSGSPIPNEIQNLIAEYTFHDHVHLMCAQRAMCRSLRAIHIPTAAVNVTNTLTFGNRKRNLMVQIQHRKGFEHTMNHALHTFSMVTGQLSACMGDECFNYHPVDMRVLYSDEEPRELQVPFADFEYDLESKELIKLCDHCGLQSEYPTSVERGQ